MKLDIVAASPLWRRAPGARAKARVAIRAAADVSGVSLRPDAEVALHLADDARLRALNAQWRGKDAPTNVLSFPLAQPARVAEAPLLGDIFVSFQTLEAEAGRQGKSFDHHFIHLTVHGFLHLLGFDHETVKQARQMEGLEVRILAKLDVADPYRD